MKWGENLENLVVLEALEVLDILEALELTRQEGRAALGSSLYTLKAMGTLTSQLKTEN